MTSSDHSAVFVLAGGLAVGWRWLTGGLAVGSRWLAVGSRG